MRKIEFIRNLLLISLVIYYSRGFLYEKGSLFFIGSVGIVLIISLFYLYKTLVAKRKKSLFYKTWTVLLILNTVGFIFTGEISNPLHYGMYLGIIMTSLTFYPFFYFAQHGVLKSAHLVRFLAIMLPITILIFFSNANMILADRLNKDTNIVNNVSYAFVALIPFVFFIKRKKLLPFSVMFIVVFFIIQGAKRGALIAGFIGLFGFIYYKIRTIPKKKRVRSYLFISLVIVAISYYAFDIYQSNEYLVSRMQKIGEVGGSSGREIIYLNLFNSWYNSDNVLNLLFGYGFAASLNLSGTGNFAHNDWFELLSNFGLLGIVIYGFLFYSAIKLLRLANWEIDKQLFFITILLIWFFITLVSMFYLIADGFMYSIVLAYVIGSNENKNIHQNILRHD